MARHPRHPGFTLIELVLVLLIISIVMAITAPNLSGWSQSAKLRDAAQDFVAVAQYARLHAVSKARIVRLHVSETNGQSPSYWLTEHDPAQLIDGDAPESGQVMDDLARGDLPDHYTMQLTVIDRPGRQYVEFFPNGRMERASVQITSLNGDSLVVESATPTEGFRLKLENKP